MLYRPLGHSDLSLSTIGFGSAWLRQLPEEQALRSLHLAFKLGINFVHTAPDYEGAVDLIARAVTESGKDVIVASQGYGLPSHFEYLFENTRAKLDRHRLDMFGIACIDDRERLGENVWGVGGLVDVLLEKKRRGQVKATFCTTHGSPEYVRTLIESGAFDSIMLAYNPLGYHLLSHPEITPGSGERLAEAPGLFSLAARHGVGLILMKTLAAGLLVPPKELQPHDPHLIPPPALTAGTIFRYLLNRHPEVTSLVPGMTTEAEVQENTAAVSAALDLAPAETEAMEVAIDRLRATVCSRCGHCDSLCSRGLRISWLFRAAHIENSRLMVFETPPNLRYFDLHPAKETAICSDCDNITCHCPFHIDIPAQLIRTHSTMFNLFRK